MTPEQRQRATEYMRGWRENNRELHNSTARESHHRNKHKHVDKRKDERLRRLYGITLEQYAQMYQLQSGLCAICNTEAKLVVDHDHDTGEVRGLLCMVCNTMLGRIEKYGVDSFSRYLKGDR